MVMVLFVQKTYVLVTLSISTINKLWTQVLLVLLLFLVVIVVVAAAVVDVVLVEVESFEGDFFLSLMVKTISLGCVRYPIA